MSAGRDGREPLSNVRDRIQVGVVGRERELGLVLAAVAAGRDILLEGPRAHEDIRQGSSVRGAIDLTLVAGQLFNLSPERAQPSAPAPHDLAPQVFEPGAGTDVELAYRETIYDAMVVALSGRIFLDEIVEVTPEQVLRRIWEDHRILGPAAAAPG